MLLVENLPDVVYQIVISRPPRSKRIENILKQVDINPMGRTINIADIDAIFVPDLYVVCIWHICNDGLAG